MYDSKNNSGWLVFGMKNLRKKKHIKRKSVVKNVHSTETITSAPTQYTEIHAKEDVDFLKSTKVDADNMEIIKEKIKLTASYRQKMLNDLSIDLLEWFPYFFTCPDLVRMLCEISYIFIKHNKYYYFFYLPDSIRFCRDTQTGQW